MTHQPQPPQLPTDVKQLDYLLCRASRCTWRTPCDERYRKDAEERLHLHERFCGYF